MNNNNTQLHHAAAWGRHRSSNGNVSRTQALLAQGLDPNAQDGWGLTPLMVAAAWGHQGVVKVLLGHPDINLEVRDVGGGTPPSSMP